MIRTFENWDKRINRIVMVLFKLTLILLGFTTKTIGGDDSNDFQNNSKYNVYFKI